MPIAQRNLPGNIAILLGVCLLVASCGGDGDSAATAGSGVAGTPASPAVAAPSAPAPPACAATSTCQLNLMVMTPDHRPVAGALVEVSGYTPYPPSLRATTDTNGVVEFIGLPSTVKFGVRHPFGNYSRGISRNAGGLPQDPVVFPSSGSLNLSATLEPHSAPTIALLPATIPASSIAADRRSLELHLRIVASATVGFQPNSWASSPGATPYLGFNSCRLWLEPGQSTPYCRYGTDAQTELLAYRYLPRAAVSGWPSSSTVDSALLLFEQSQRSASSDPHALRSTAGRMFVRRAVGGEVDAAPDLVFAAAFSSSNNMPVGSPPPWPPLVFSYSSGESPSPEDMVDGLDLANWGAGPAPVLAALGAATHFIAAETRATGQRTVVALVGGADESGLSLSDGEAALSALRQSQVDAGVRTVFVASWPAMDASERNRLAAMAAALEAPLVIASHPNGSFDGLYAALGLAADLHTGAQLPTMEAVFRLHAEPGMSFQSGSMLRGTLYTESDDCPMGCGEWSFEFEVRIP